MKTISRYIMTLALLLTAVTGAWATDPTVYESGQTVNQNDLKVGDIILGGVTINGTNDGGYINLIAGRFSRDGNILDVNSEVNRYPITVNADGSWKHPNTTWVFAPIDASGQAGNAWEVTAKTQVESDYDVSIVGIQYVADAIDFKWDAATKTGTFTMPAFDVEIAPIYAPTAMFATDGNLVLTPTAIEGIYAESTDAIVTAGTVANIGETENPQGIVMYAVTSTNQATAPALSAFSADVPTAKDITVGSDVLVWYYIKGADAPEGQTATAENTFNDSEICATPITVTVLSNKFDINFKAANDNTIEAGKATVTVGGTAATVTEGKLEGVKMGSEVKVTAKDGYKFRKVEAKKGGPTTIVTWNSSDFYFDENPYTKDGVTLTPSNDMAASGNNLYEFGDNTFTTTLGKFIKIEIEFESTTHTFDGWTKGTGEQYQPDTQTYPDWWENLVKLTWTGDAESVTIKGKDVFGIHSITFTIQ